ncbi:MAG: universal stress protein [Chitinophagaceae bacterium]|nr:MAG: universal stress protein [Chitinophagaceae bacterium]
MKNILVAIDFEGGAILLIDKANELAEKFGSKVWVVHVAAPDPEFVGIEIGPPSVREFRAKELRGEHRTIQHYTSMLNEKGIKAEGLLIPGATVDTIVEESFKLNIDLIIIGHHKHGFLYKTFAGNTDASLIKKSKVPVLIIPL